MTKEGKHVQRIATTPIQRRAHTNKPIPINPIRLMLAVGSSIFCFSTFIKWGSYLSEVRVIHTLGTYC
jgi:hypothetical protein